MTGIGEEVVSMEMALTGVRQLSAIAKPDIIMWMNVEKFVRLIWPEPVLLSTMTSRFSASISV